MLAQDILQEQINSFLKENRKAPNAILLTQELIEVYTMDFLKEKNLICVLVEDNYLPTPRLMFISDFKNLKNV